MTSEIAKRALKNHDEFVQSWDEYGKQHTFAEKTNAEFWWHRARVAADAEVESIRGENTRLRAALANSPGACVYCQLPADEGGTP